VPINVGFSIEHHEAAAIEYAATRVVGPRQHMVLFDPVSEDISLELELEDANDLDVARAKAESLYKKIREVAGLPEAPPALTGAYRFGVVEDPASVFINEAEDMFEERRHELAVLAAQTACEVAARTAVERLVQGPSAQRVPLGSGYLNRWSLTDPASMMLFHAATGSRAWDEKWWSKYKAHVTRRNNVAHKGAGVTRDEARESLDIMWDFINYVRQAEGAMQAPPI
jgi:hypothetical protein